MFQLKAAETYVCAQAGETYQSPTGLTTFHMFS